MEGESVSEKSVVKIETPLGVLHVNGKMKFRKFMKNIPEGWEMKFKVKKAKKKRGVPITGWKA
jgi:hypothetical protein